MSKVEVKMNEETVQYYITKLENLCKELQQKVKQLETNWNELKKWLSDEFVYSYLEEILTSKYVSEVMLKKIEELEGGSNE